MCPRNSRSANLSFLVPGDLPGPSGGTSYNVRLTRELNLHGTVAETVHIPGSWPNAAPEDHDALSAALNRTRTAVVDGIMASASPAAITRAVSRGVRVYLLLHLPLPAETGIPDTERSRLAEMEQTALFSATGVICTSNWAGRHIASRYGLHNAAAALPGTDVQPAAPGSTPPRLLMVASLIPRKNQAMVLAALRQLTDLEWSARFVGPEGRAGNGGPSDYVHGLRQAAAEHFEPGRITFPGARQGVHLEAEWACANLLLLPSIAETFGMAVTEALAHGIPAVVGAGTGAVEALRGTATPDAPLAGTAVDTANPDELALTLRRWFQDDGVQRCWRAAALQRRDTLRTWADTAIDFQRILTP